MGKQKKSPATGLAAAPSAPETAAGAPHSATEPAPAAAAAAESAEPTSAAGADAAVPASDAAATALTVAEEGAAGSRPIIVRLHLPFRSEPVAVPVSLSESVQDLRAWTFELQESSFTNCFYLECSGKRLNEFDLLSNVEGLVDNSAVYVRLDTYNDRLMREHVRRVKEALCAAQQPYPWLAQATENLSIPLAGNVPTKTTGVENVNGPLASLFEALVPLKTARALESLEFDHWNPPPSHRALQGDLGYLVVKTVELDTIHITCSATGFFVNQSTATSFAPRPAAHPCAHHNLIPCLERRSQAFKAAFATIQKNGQERNPCEFMPSPFKLHHWCLPLLPVYPDASRADVANMSLSECDVNTPGLMRDWNDDFQTVRDMPKSTTQEAFTRDRNLCKLNSDFVSTAVRGAKAIVLGNITSLNPTEDPSVQVFLWNNIFFTFALDGAEHFKAYGGKAAAHVTSGNDLRGIMAVSKLDIPGCCTLPAAVIDLAGRRIFAQGWVPGLLRKDESTTTIHGSLDHGVHITLFDTIHTLLATASKELHIKPHKVLDAEGKEFLLNASVECKGVRAFDGRNYLIDLDHTTPVDYNFCEASLTLDMPPLRHKCYVMRHELIPLYLNFLQAQHKQHNGKDSQASEETTEVGTDAIANEIQSAMTATSDGADDTALAERVAFATKEPLVLPTFNPDVFQPLRLGGTKEEIEADENDVKALAAFITSQLLPRLIGDLASEQILLHTGSQLRDIMHARGIGMRYLGTVVDGIQAIPGHSKTNLLVCAMELVARCVKALYRDLLGSAPPHLWAVSTARFLNCIFDNIDRAIPKNKRSALSPALAALNHKTAWKAIEAAALTNFRFALPPTPLEAFNIDKLALLRAVCLKTGIQIVAGKYTFGQTDSPAFTAEDILDLTPVVKHLDPESGHVNSVFELGCRFFHNNRIEEGLAILDEVRGMYLNVYGAIHPSIAQYHRAMSNMLLETDKAEEALAHLEKCVMIFERVDGLDEYTVAKAYAELAMLYRMRGRLREAIGCLLHARLLTRLAAGPNHVELASHDASLGILYSEANQREEAVRCLEQANALQIQMYGEGQVRQVRTLQLLAVARSNIYNFKEAMSSERAAADILAKHLGKDHKLTKDSEASLSRYTANAVKLAKELQTLQAGEQATTTLSLQSGGVATAKKKKTKKLAASSPSAAATAVAK